jgi:thiol peroxidase
VIILNESNEVIYSELVNEITEEPNYDEALSALR